MKKIMISCLALLPLMVVAQAEDSLIEGKFNDQFGQVTYYGEAAEATYKTMSQVRAVQSSGMPGQNLYTRRSDSLSCAKSIYSGVGTTITYSCTFYPDQAGVSAALRFSPRPIVEPVTGAKGTIEAKMLPGGEFVDMVISGTTAVYLYELMSQVQEQDLLEGALTYRIGTNISCVRRNHVGVVPGYQCNMNMGKDGILYPDTVVVPMH